MSHIRRAFRDENGAVTVDWVVLTASVVFLALGAIGVSLKDPMLEVVGITAEMVEGAMPEE